MLKHADMCLTKRYRIVLSGPNTLWQIDKLSKINMEVKSCKWLPCIYLYLLGPKRRPSGIHGTGEEIQEY
jgi:hypothetical protein